MLKRIISFSIKNKLIIGIGSLALILWGSFSLSQLPIDAVPDITDNQVQIITTSPSLAAPEVERLISFPIELKMASIPQLNKVRSFSRFGLSVVTLVFEEKVDIYWARQQVSERLQQLNNEIPKQVGIPEMAPITTGLGEIYQYVVETTPEYREKYSLQELRKIQDWIIRRQLLGTPGVADVSALGGKLQQFEIAVNPDLMAATGISLTELYKALESNNENTGGAYIERNDAAYFIRSEGLVTSLTDIENIVVRKQKNGAPLLVRDVANVKLGNAVRYGASSRNGNGEVVSAIVMMLKGENSSKVIEEVTKKIESIQKTLPEGVVITPFLDRTHLVNRAIGTVTQNLIEGALIVIFVLLLILGNFRAGLIVASVIPLALFFAFGMMQLFGVSGNLMSLGAVDFGLIVDGAVIIVESSLHHLFKRKSNHRLSQTEMDTEILGSASSIMNSAAFGEIIILIVYVPLLALVGTEGKMFKPMAQTVSFAILGAFILSLTYVPVVSSLFLSKNKPLKASISDKAILKLQKGYHRILSRFLAKKKLVMVISIVLLIVSFWRFSKLGGEFVPTLDEGDLAVQATLLTGSSLSASLNVTAKAEKLLLQHFPEVKQVVSKIGSGEIPTDPMPIEAADIMIVLKDRKEWQSAKDRESLVDSMSTVLSQIPGVNFSFQQPIQMRFNELMTGVRQDVAIKIYGEDLKKLSFYAQEVGKLVSATPGAEDVYVEEVTGVPQMVIRFKRESLSRFHIDISEINQQIQMAFAGSSTGKVYLGEQWFDMVVRLDDRFRSDINAIKTLPIITGESQTIPLEVLADVELVNGPYQIQRDDTRRRIIVAFNVRNSDVETLVNELKSKLNSNISFEPGYSATFGGQFENLMEAKKRLSIAVPFALLLILILLFFAFKSVAQSLLIFSAIPFSAIGGIWALSLREIPFSISAGVGFIALFGVAVLNGIVLISEFNLLKQQGIHDVHERILTGAKNRLRPVIMTASVASLGFLPMAISSSAGAEVQKPLATVVIGGLVSATILTLLVLPILYWLFETRKSQKGTLSLALLLFFFLGNSVQAQTPSIKIKTVKQAIEFAQEHNLELMSQRLKKDASKIQVKSQWKEATTQVSAMSGQYNSVFDTDNHFALNQQIPNPLRIYAQTKRDQELAHLAILTEKQKRAENEFQIKLLWSSIFWNQKQQQILLNKESKLKRLYDATSKRYELGDASELEVQLSKSVLESTRITLLEIQNQELQSIYDLKLNIGLSDTDSLIISEDVTISLAPFTLPIQSSNALMIIQSSLKEKEWNLKSTKRTLWPDIQIGYFNQSLNGPSTDLYGNDVWHKSSDRFTGLTLGIDIPIVAFPSKLNQIKAASVRYQAEQQQSQFFELQFQNEVKKLQNKAALNEVRLTQIQETLLPTATILEQQLQSRFEKGQIGIDEYTRGLEKVWNIEMQAIESQKEYQSTLIELEFLNKK